MTIGIRNHLIKPGNDGAFITENMIDGIEFVNGEPIMIQYHVIGWDVCCATNDFTIEEFVYD